MSNPQIKTTVTISPIERRPNSFVKINLNNQFDNNHLQATLNNSDDLSKDIIASKNESDNLAKDSTENLIQSASLLSELGSDWFDEN